MASKPSTKTGKVSHVLGKAYERLSGGVFLQVLAKALIRRGKNNNDASYSFEE